MVEMLIKPIADYTARIAKPTLKPTLQKVLGRYPRSSTPSDVRC